MLERLVKKIYELRQNEYLYRRDKVRNLVSHWLRLASVGGWQCYFSIQKDASGKTCISQPSYGCLCDFIYWYFCLAEALNTLFCQLLFKAGAHCPNIIIAAKGLWFPPPKTNILLKPTFGVLLKIKHRIQKCA